MMSAIPSPKRLRKLGKAQVREQFAPIVESLCTEGGIVEVTDYGKVAAVLLSYKDYLSLTAQAHQPFRPKRTLAGSAVLVGELEAASQQIIDSVLKSMKKSAHEL